MSIAFIYGCAVDDLPQLVKIQEGLKEGRVSQAVEIREGIQAVTAFGLTLKSV